MTKKLSVIIASACLAVVTAAETQAVTLTFDDVPGGSSQGNYGDMPIYEGFAFSFTLDWVDLVASSWSYGAHSGEFAILNNNGGVGIVTAQSGADFTFDGLWAKAWGTSPDSGGPDDLVGTLEGWRDGAQIWSVSTGLNGSYEYYGAQAGMIDELRLAFGNHFLVDDMSLNGADVTPDVPVPAAAPLLLGALAAFGVAARRRAA